MAQELEAQARPAVAARSFGDRLAAAVDERKSQLLVGLDPRPELLPVELRGDIHHGRASAADAVGRFCRGLIDAVSPYVVGVKPQLAFFETLGADGMRAFEDTCDYARAANLLVLADAKRGDIGSTARAYADAYLEEREDRSPPVDALTVNPYLGGDSIEPFVAACRRNGTGIFCLVKTSNAGSADIQDAALSDGRRVWQQVAELVNEWGQDLVGERGLSSVGAVVGATYPRAVGEALNFIGTRAYRGRRNLVYPRRCVLTNPLVSAPVRDSTGGRRTAEILSSSISRRRLWVSRSGEVRGTLSR